MKVVDVVVVGAGPAGTTAANLIAGQGYEVELLDRSSFPRDKPCGEFINPAACDLLEEAFQIGRTDLTALGGVPVNQVRLELNDGRPLDIPIVDHAGEPASGISLRRSVFDFLLVNRCRQASVQVYEQRNVHSVDRDGNRMIVSGSEGDGAAFSRRARMVIAADGTHSKIARRERLTVPNRRLDRIGLVAHFRDVASARQPEPGVWMFPSAGDGMLFGFSRQANGRAVLSGSAPKSSSARVARGSEQFVKQWIQSKSDLTVALGSAIFEGSVRTTACFGHRLKRTFAPGLLFLGDAARFADPFTGEGIHHAIESGILAAETAVRALSANDTTARMLGQYEAARSELGPRYTLCELVSAVCAKPRLLDFVGIRLKAQPRLAQVLVGAIADLIPARSVLDSRFLLQVLASSPK